MACVYNFLVGDAFSFKGGQYSAGHSVPMEWNKGRCCQEQLQGSYGLKEDAVKYNYSANGNHISI